MRKVTHARKRNPWTDREELLNRCRSPRRNHICQLLWLSLMGFERGWGQILGFSIDSRRLPYNTLALPCECVISHEWRVFTQLVPRMCFLGVWMMTHNFKGFNPPPKKKTSKGAWLGIFQPNWQMLNRNISGKDPIDTKFWKGNRTAQLT